MFHIISFLTSLDKLTNTHTDTDIQVVLVRDKKESRLKGPENAASITHAGQPGCT